MNLKKMLPSVLRSKTMGEYYCRQFHQHFTYELYVHVTRKKLPKRRSYKKCVQKTLMKLTPVEHCAIQNQT